METAPAELEEGTDERIGEVANREELAEDVEPLRRVLQGDEDVRDEQQWQDRSVDDGRRGIRVGHYRREGNTQNTEHRRADHEGQRKRGQRRGRQRRSVEN